MKKEYKQPAIMVKKFSGICCLTQDSNPTKIMRYDEDPAEKYDDDDLEVL